MNQKSLIINYTACKIEELNADDRTLVEAAKQATHTSYAPYSNFKVGAAVRLSNNVIVKGSNQENAAFGAGTCAERCTMFYANAQYPNEHITSIAVAARGTDDAFTRCPISPCGVCRQALIEAQKRAGADIRVLLYGEDRIELFESMSQLLPFQFDEIV